MVLVYVSIIASLATITFADLMDLSVDLIIIFGAVLIGTFIFLYILPGWKIVGSKNLAVGIAMAQLLGYPATYLITQEIARTVGKTEEEVDAIAARIEPAYVLAGFRHCYILLHHHCWLSSRTCFDPLTESVIDLVQVF